MLQILIALILKLCEEKWIHRQLKFPTIPQQYGVVERRNCALLDMVRSMMAKVDLVILFFGDVILTIAYFLNRVSSKLVLTIKLLIFLKV